MLCAALWQRHSCVVLSFPSRPGQAVLASCWAWHREGAQRTVCERLEPRVDGTRAAQGTELSLQPAVPLRWIQRGAPRSGGASSPAAHGSATGPTCHQKSLRFQTGTSDPEAVGNLSFPDIEKSPEICVLRLCDRDFQKKTHLGQAPTCERIVAWEGAAAIGIPCALWSEHLPCLFRGSRGPWSMMQVLFLARHMSGPVYIPASGSALPGADCSIINTVLST